MFSRNCLRWVLYSVALSCSAQDLRMTGPITGLVFDGPSRSLRLILGMPGAARLDTTLVSDVEWASVAPNGRIAIMVRQGEARLFSRDAMDSAPDGTAINGVVESPVLSAWAADSSAVALFSTRVQSLQWVRFDTQGATAESAVALAGVEGAVTALSADAGSRLAVVAVENAGVYRISTRDGVALVLPIPDASAIALESGGRTLWVADRGNAQVVEVALDQEWTAATVLLTDAERFADLSVIGLSSDRKSLYLADRFTKRLYLFERSTALLSEPIVLDVPATLLTPLGRSSVLLLGQRGKLDDPLYILDESSGPSIYFVPVLAGDQL